MKPIILIGFMGSGKSSVGRALSEQWGEAFIDTDTAIEAKEGCSIAHLFETYGEAQFRLMEQEIFAKILLLEKYKIIATGGGIVLRDENIQLMRDKGIPIYLKATRATIYERIKEEKQQRPLLHAKNVEEKIDMLLEKRTKIYETAGKYTISVDNKSIEAITKEIEVILDANTHH